MKPKFDLRVKVSIGETWLLSHISGYMGYTAIYRFDGKGWNRKLAHENCNMCVDIRTYLFPKEFKELFEKCDTTQWLGCLLLGGGTS